MIWNNVKKKLCETVEKSGKTGEKVQQEQEEQECTEALHGVIMLRKGRLEERDVWFGTVGNQLVSDSTFETKKELIDNLEDVTLDRICKIVAGAFERAINYKKETL